ncbi:hypothetical protein J4G07_14665, partial [Candidatus Poribacteria bacterium]|nr:hypothetical protein [Candidatus Poribacteria bacterium]
HRDRQKMITHNTNDIQIIVQVAQRLIVEKFMSRISHGMSGIRHLSPYKCEASPQPCGYACKACQPDTINPTIILDICQIFLSKGLV